MGSKPTFLVFSILCEDYSLKTNISFPVPSTRKKEIIEISKALETGHFKPLIDIVYPIGDITKAFEYVSTGQKTGSILVKIT
jgi:NADPH:quinone reductase-like Zn-dependent oxidoreductase